MWRLTAALALACLSGCASGRGPRPFTTDGCTMFPDGTRASKDLWLSCCTEHDRAYWAGGARAERSRADRALRDCVRAAGRPKTAALMWAGVRLGGTPYLPTRSRWGYGWPYGRGYRPLSDEERRALGGASTPP